MTTSKSYTIKFNGYNVNVVENATSYTIDFCTGSGEATYLKEDWTLEEALNDQANLDSEEEQAPHYYTINGVKVFLARESEMQGVEPYEVNYQTDINAYRLEDYRKGVDTRETYYESYGGSYDDGLEICIANVVNAENEQHVFFGQWICADELDEVNEEIESRGFDYDIYGNK